MEAVKKRQSNFELLRIISIFLIVIHHFAIWTPWDFESHGNFYRLTINTLMIGGKVGVNLFIMITAYFMINSSIKFRSVAKLVVEVTLFSVFLYLLTIIFQIQGAKFDWPTAVKSSLPILYNRYWFMTAYFQLYLLIPLLNSGLHQLSQIAYKNLLIVFFFIFSIWPMIYIENGVTSAHLLWFIYIYALGGYFRLYPKMFQKSIFNYSLKLVISVIVTLFCTYLLTLLLSDDSNTGYYFVKEFLGWYTNIFVTREYSPFLLFISIFIFLIFMNLTINSNRVINKVASLTLGVYLFQSTPVISGWLWNDIFKGNQFNYSWQVFLYSLFVGSILFVVGIILSLILHPLVNGLTKLITIGVSRLKLSKGENK